MARLRAIPVRSRPLPENFRRHRILLGILAARARRLWHGRTIRESAGGSSGRIASLRVTDRHGCHPAVFAIESVPTNCTSHRAVAPYFMGRRECRCHVRDAFGGEPGGNAITQPLRRPCPSPYSAL